MQVSITTPAYKRAVHRNDTPRSALCGFVDMELSSVMLSQSESRLSQASGPPAAWPTRQLSDSWPSTQAVRPLRAQMPSPQLGVLSDKIFVDGTIAIGVTTITLVRARLRIARDAGIYYGTILATGTPGRSTDARATVASAATKPSSIRLSQSESRPSQMSSPPCGSPGTHELTTAPS